MSVMVFVAQAECSKWFCKHSFPTRTTAAIELLNITKQVPESLTMASIQPFSSLHRPTSMFYTTELLTQPPQSASVKTHMYS